MSTVPLEELRAIFGCTHVRKIVRGLYELGITPRMVGGLPLVARSVLDRALESPPAAAPDNDIDMAARIARAKGGRDGKKTTQRRRSA